MCLNNHKIIYLFMIIIYYFDMIFLVTVCFNSHYRFVQQTISMFKFNLDFFFHNWIFPFKITYFEQIFMLTRLLNHNWMKTMGFRVLFHLLTHYCFQLSHKFHGFRVDPIIWQFTICFNILFFNSSGTHVYLPKLAYNHLWGFMNFVDSKLPRVNKSFSKQVVKKMF
jgi:hypothetical protein